MADNSTNNSLHPTVSYADAGVSIDRANDAKQRIKQLAARTFNARTLTEIGSFGGMFDAAFPEMKQPVLVASADGVGTKLKVAFMIDKHDTVGRDLVNHCVNDILVQGARPLFFLDYIATGVLEPTVIEQIIKGISDGCVENRCALLGGETAEMPGFYQANEYDIAGFIVGIVDREKILNGEQVVAGDAVLGLASDGLHTNGYSLARKLFFEVAGHQPATYLDDLGTTVGQTLLAPHRSYLKSLEKVLDKVHALAHITGGGLTENIPRVLPENLSVEIDLSKWAIPPVFQIMQRIGNIEHSEMLRTFNCGIGMVAICDFQHAEQLIRHVTRHGETCYEIGRVVSGNREVIYV